jgi:diguanylate cyclase (GGDEF)-like protein/hemerythrin-like metal-binding protein/PAS domain S-box-containing protein
MDIFTLTVIQSLASVIQVAALYGLYRMDKTHSGYDWWTFGSAFLALGFVFNFLRSFPALSLITVVVSNALFFTGLALLYIGVLRFFGKREHRGWLILSGTLFSLSTIYFTYISYDLTVRRLLISAVVAAISLVISRAIFIHRIRSVTTSARFLAAVFLVFGCFFILRAGALLFAASSPAFVAALMQPVTYLITIFVTTLWTFGFIIMVNQRLNSESKRNEEKYRVLFRDSPDAYLIVVNGIFVDCNRASEIMLHGDRSYIVGQSPDFLSPEYQPDGKKSVEAVEEKIAEALKSGINIFEWVHRRLDGEDFYVEVSIASMMFNGQPALFTTWRDITERKRVEKLVEEYNHKLEMLSITDGLTGIANRRHFDGVLAQEYARHSRSGAELSLIMLDIDYFKAFNDNYGHIKGDDCLRQVGRVLAECASRPSDLAARYGGEEFVCIIPETDSSGAYVIAEKIRCTIMALAIPHCGSSVADVVTASLGVVTVQCSADKTADDILVRVDELLYRAKSSGRNRVEYEDKTRSEAADGISGNYIQLVWKDTFCCGNQLIDTQHQQLFHVANELIEATLGRRPAAEISVNIARLLADVRKHFHDEQLILEAAGYTELHEHIAEHTALLTRGAELSSLFDSGSLSVGDIFQFLVDDIVMTHLLDADRQYFPFLDAAA